MIVCLEDKHFYPIIVPMKQFSTTIFLAEKHFIGTIAFKGVHNELDFRLKSISLMLRLVAFFLVEKHSIGQIFWLKRCKGEKLMVKNSVWYCQQPVLW